MTAKKKPQPKVAPKAVPDESLPVYAKAAVAPTSRQDQPVNFSFNTLSDGSISLHLSFSGFVKA